MRRIGRIILLISFVFVLAAPAGAQFFFMKNPLIGQEAPNFTLDTLKEKSVQLKDYRNGQSAIVFFWATWCPHCLAQLKDMNQRVEEFKQKGVKIILVDVGENPKQVSGFVEKNKIAFDVFLDQEETLSESYNLIGVPTFFFINEKGIIKAIEHALPDDYEKILKEG